MLHWQPDEKLCPWIGKKAKEERVFKRTLFQESNQIPSDLRRLNLILNKIADQDVDYSLTLNKSDYTSYLAVLLRCEVYPVWYVPPDFSVSFKTEEEFVKLQWQRDEQAKQLGQRYEIDAWVAANQIAPISYSDWLYLNPLIKRAIILEVEDILGRRESSRAEQERKFQSMVAEQASGVKFPISPASNIQGIIGR